MAENLTESVRGGVGAEGHGPQPGTDSLPRTPDVPAMRAFRNALAMALLAFWSSGSGSSVSPHPSTPPTGTTALGSSTGALQCTVGALSAGNFLKIENMTISAAHQWCLGSSRCGGFTTRSTSCDAGSDAAVRYRWASRPPSACVARS